MWSSQGSIHLSSAIAGVLAALLACVAVAQEHFATVNSDDGTQYLFYRNNDSITAAAASAKCKAAGGKLASLASAEQVRDSLWSPAVIEAVEEMESELLWTGLKITWNDRASRHRRMLLRGRNDDGGFLTNLFGSSSNPDDNNSISKVDDAYNDSDDTALIERFLTQMDATADFLVPTHSPDGRRLPQLLRLWLFQQQQQQQQHIPTQISPHRSLLAGDGASPYLDDAVLTWADGSGAEFVLATPSNMGFLACNRKKVAECCGAVFDIGPGPYPGSDFPTIFFYPCGGERVSGVMLPSGFICAVEPPVAALPRPTPPVAKSVKPQKSTSPASNTRASTATKKCDPGSMPATRASTKHLCTQCKPNTFSDDGTTCKKCTVGSTSGRGASECH